MQRALPTALCTLLFAATLVPAAAEGSFPGKPGRIAFSVGSYDDDPGPAVDGQADIWSVDPDGANRLRLTTPGGEPDFNAAPAWSPDGSLIAFQSAFPFTPAVPYPIRPDSTIFMITASGGTRRPAGGGTSPLFFPGGQRYYSFFLDVDGLQRGVSSQRLDGTDRRPEPDDVYQTQGPQFSPDGREVLASIAGDIYISLRDGTTGRRNLTNTPDAFETDPVFAPDASAIAYATRPNPGSLSPAVEVMDLQSGERSLVSEPGVSSFDPDWGPIPVRCGGRKATLVGTPDEDRLVGTKGRDVLAGLGGRDVLVGKKGNDVLCGNLGPDRLVGGKGRRDRCLGGKGRGKLVGCES